MVKKKKKSPKDAYTAGLERFWPKLEQEVRRLGAKISREGTMNSTQLPNVGKLYFNNNNNKKKRAKEKELCPTLTNLNYTA